MLFLLSKPITYISLAVRRLLGLRADKTLNALLGRFSNGTVVFRLELSLSNFQPAGKMCMHLTLDTHHANQHSH
jgi:hypothetical protein